MDLFEAAMLRRGGGGGGNSEGVQEQLDDINTKMDFLFRVDKPAENMATFSSGTKTWTCPEGVFKVCALIQGGGQGGYRYNVSSTSDNTYYIGIPEMSSGKAIFLENIPVTPGQTYTFTVGAGGTYGGAVESGKKFGSAGEMGAASEAFGYTSDDADHFKYQYTQSGGPNAIANNQEYAKEFQNHALSLKGSTTNAYHKDGSYANKNGASSKFLTASTSGTSGNSGSGKAGVIIVFY